MRDTTKNSLNTLNLNYCFSFAISNQHNNLVIKYLSNFHEHYFKHLYSFLNEARLIDVNDIRIIDFSQLIQFY